MFYQDKSRETIDYTSANNEALIYYNRYGIEAQPAEKANRVEGGVSPDGQLVVCKPYVFKFAGWRALLTLFSPSPHDAPHHEYLQFSASFTASRVSLRCLLSPLASFFPRKKKPQKNFFFEMSAPHQNGATNPPPAGPVTQTNGHRAQPHGQGMDALVSGKLYQTISPYHTSSTNT